MKLNLADFWKLFSIPQPVEEYRFIPNRKFRADFAWPKHRILLEVNGGVWIGGRHTRGKGYERDLEKMNLAQDNDWKIFQFTPQQFKNGEAGEFMSNVFSKLKEKNHG